MKKAKKMTQAEQDAFENEPDVYSDPTLKMTPEAKKIYLDGIERDKQMLGVK
jgi:hypothetical protein